MHIGQTDTTSVKCLINSISRFIHLVSCQTMKPVTFQKICNNMVGVLKRLKPVLDDVMDHLIPSDVNLCKECEELDKRVNEARDFIEKWSPKTSRIHSVLQGGTLLIKLQSTSLDICHMIVRSLQSPPSASVLANLQELQCLKKEIAMVYIEEALRNQRDNIEPCKVRLKEIIELLKLTSNQELLKESIAVEKERLNTEANKMIADIEEINEIVNLVRSLRDYVIKTECPVVKSGLSIPPYFLCPLSLELMLDPVIVASGQTYERQSIQKWLDHGLTVCPKTRQRLTHTNLIPNYTVKAMIATWCEENNVKLSGNSEHKKYACVPMDNLLPQDLTHDCRAGSLSSSNSISRSSLQTENAFEKQKGNNSTRLCGEYNGCQSEAAEKCEQESPYTHSRSESFSSSISSTDCAVSKEVSGISSRHQNVKVLSGEITNTCPSPGNKQSGISPLLSGKTFQNPGSNVGLLENGNNNDNNNNNSNNNSLSIFDSHSVFNSGSDELTTSSQASRLIEDLHSQSIETQTTAAEELRLLTKHNRENRTIVGQCGAAMPLLSLLYSDMKVTQEHAVTALLNLSINEDNKALIMEAGAIEPLIHVLKTGNDSAKENSAATLFSLSVIENNKARIGRSGAVKALVDLLASGTLRGKKDAATALFNLSIFHENKARIVQAGAVKFLVRLMDNAGGMADKSVALLSNLSTIPEGRIEIARERGIPLLVEFVESGSQRGKENAASILLQLCLHSSKFCNLVLQEGAVPPLVALSVSGTPRAKEKAQQLLSHFRNQREQAASGKGKS
uniref:RING-type E3 ubiquitin transferase n=1 Tax=Phaseolus vulgaris TaxID=3885 RepID=V7BIR6_PHAVU|nr:hypothetical protein PHAVU_007G192300g [Phaseolus vulgaris]ESW16883.1 hypothetical protein PHAVU_007G192300g [Phaseolus vulgaris]